MCAEQTLALLASSVRYEKARMHTLFWPQLEVFSYFLKKFATNRVTAKYNDTVMRYMYFRSMTPKQFAGNKIAKSFNAADVYEDSTLTNSFTWGENGLVHLSLRY